MYLFLNNVFISRKAVLLASCIILAVLSITLTPLSCQAAPQISSIGVIQVIEHAALDKTRKGIQDELAAQGFSCPDTLKWAWESAQGNLALATQIAEKFSDRTVVVAIGTISAQAAMSRLKDKGVAIVFSSVTDPVSAKLIEKPYAPTKKITGVSNAVDVKQQFIVFKKILPKLKTIGVIYNPGEANSVALNKIMQEIADSMGITLILAPAPRTSEVSSAAQSLVNKVDALFVNNDSTALAAFDAVVKVGKSKRIPVFVSDVDQINNGAVAALGPDQYDIGRQTGRMIARILRGETPDKIPIEYPKKVELHLNLNAAKEIGLEIPKQVQDQAVIIVGKEKS